MAYTTVYGKQTAEHIESDDWHNSRGQKLRIHRYRCRACKKEYIYADKLYERCPFCGFPILHFRRAG